MELLALQFQSRGLGIDGGAPCFVCGKPDVPPHSRGDNIAAFVDGKRGGERVAGLFTACASHGRLDYRDFEPNWVQYKVLCCKDHLPNLERLHELTYPDGLISVERLLGAMHG